MLQSCEGVHHRKPRAFLFSLGQASLLQVADQTLQGIVFHRAAEMRKFAEKTDSLCRPKRRLDGSQSAFMLGPPQKGVVLRVRVELQAVLLHASVWIVLVQDRVVDA